MEFLPAPRPSQQKHQLLWGIFLPLGRFNAAYYIQKCPGRSVRKWIFTLLLVRARENPEYVQVRNRYAERMEIRQVINQFAHPELIISFSTVTVSPARYDKLTHPHQTLSNHNTSSLYLYISILLSPQHTVEEVIFFISLYILRTKPTHHGIRFKPILRSVNPTVRI